MLTPFSINPMVVLGLNKRPDRWSGSDKKASSLTINPIRRITVLNQKVIRGWQVLRVIISIILVSASHTVLLYRQYCNTSKAARAVDTVISVLSLLFVLYTIYWMIVVGCALSDQCYNDWVGI